MRRALFTAMVLAAAGCGDPEVQVVEITAAEHGKDLFADPATAGGTNKVSCATCHAENEADAKHLSGGHIAGATLRTSYWGGQENTLSRSINHCRNFFMTADEAWDGTEDDAVAIYAYLESLEDGASADAVPFTIGDVVDPGEGDAAKGKVVYDKACASCHGTKSTAEGRLLSAAPTLPEETLIEHPEPKYDDEDRLLVFVEKIRHGGFLGYGGTMPPFSLEAISDQELADLLSYLEVPRP